MLVSLAIQSFLDDCGPSYLLLVSKLVLSVSFSESTFLFNEFKPVLYVLLYQVQGIWMHIVVLDPFNVWFCAVLRGC